MLGSRSFYALWHGMIFEFQNKAFRDWFVANGDAEIISSKDVYRSYDFRNFIKVSHHCYKRSKAWEDYKRRRQNELSQHNQS